MFHLVISSILSLKFSETQQSRQQARGKAINSRPGQISHARTSRSRSPFTQIIGKPQGRSHAPALPILINKAASQLSSNSRTLNKKGKPVQAPQRQNPQVWPKKNTLTSAKKALTLGSSGLIRRNTPPRASKTTTA